MPILPDFAAFAGRYESGEPQALYVRLVADLETPVSAYLKLAEGRDNAFLFESVQGGEARGRYSIIGLKPDLIWRCRNGNAEVNRNARSTPDSFAPDATPPLQSLRALINETHMALPEGVPPMAVGIFGYLGYDMVRLIEKLPNCPPDTLGLPDAILVRPTITAIFDTVRDEILIVTPVWPQDGLDARAAYARASERLGDAVADLERSAPASPAPPVDLPSMADIQSNMTHDEYLAMVDRAKEYVRAGDIFQVVPSSALPPPVRAAAVCALSRAAPPQPLAVFVQPRLSRFFDCRVEPRNPCQTARRHSDDPSHRRHAPARCDARTRQRIGQRADGRPEGACRAPDAD